MLCSLKPDCEVERVSESRCSGDGSSGRATKGDTATIRRTKGLAEDTITHWHGMFVAYPNDGHPREIIGPGTSYSYAFTIQQRACLNWYHPHPHMLAGEQVALGLAGGFISNDAEEAALGLPSGTYEIALIIRDAGFDRSGNLAYTPKSGGFMGNTPLVNGTLNPKLAVDRAVYRFRIPNQTELWRFTTNGNAPHPVHVHGAAFQVVSRSGGRATLFPWEAGWKDTVLLEDGETVEVPIQFTAFRSLYVLHRHKLEHEDMGMMANFEVV